MQDDVGLGDAADKMLGVQAIDYRQALRAGCGKLVKRFIHPLGGRDARKILVHDVCCDNHRFKLGPVEKAFDIVKRNCAK